MATFNALLTGTVAPGAVANPLLFASAAKLVRKLFPALVHVAPSVEVNNWMRNPAGFEPLVGALCVRLDRHDRKPPGGLRRVRPPSSGNLWIRGVACGQSD